MKTNNQVIIQEIESGIRCQYCGTLLRTNSKTGDGCGQKIHIKSMVAAFYKFAYLDVYVIIANMWKRNMLELYKDHKFKKGFKSDFYKSMVNSDRVSKKQLAIIKDMVCSKADSESYRAMITQEYSYLKIAKKDFFSAVYNTPEYLQYKTQIEKELVEKKLAEKKSTPLGKLVLQYWEVKAA